MPRPRVKDQDRKRVARACDTCKRRKEKCDGSQPCLLCRRRSREAECTYSLVRQRKSQTQESISEESPSIQLGEALASSDDAEIAIESLLTLSGNRSAPKSPAGNGVYEAPVSHAPVPKLARLLRDGHGKFIFVGDSATLAFLQNIRRLARIAIGECNLTADQMRHAMIEVIPNESGSVSTPSLARTKPSRTEAEALVQYYLLAASGMIDLFDPADILQHLAAWTESAGPSNTSTDSIFYLVLAIGAKNRPGTHEEQAENYFVRGRELAVSSFMDDPSVLTVQSYVLIAFYLLTACRRNGAFMLLGVAIRAAYALGMHRSDISVLFEASERRTRERVWKSLRVIDLFMSASLGRPPATSEVDGGNVSWEGNTRGYENIRLGALHSSSMLRICFIFERVLNEVYCRREVDVQLVNSISRQYRDWNLHLEAGLNDDNLTDDQMEAVPVLQRMIGVAHAKGAYYWSIILLTRPFLIFDVSSKFKEPIPSAAPSPRSSSDTLTLSEACVDAALRSIEIASDVIHAPDCPTRPIFITNSTFVSALVVGLAALGDYDKSFPLMSSLDQAKLVLSALAKHDPASRRYAVITGYLQQAALEHIRRREEKQLQRRRQGINSMFGDLLERDKNESLQQNSTSQITSGITTAQPSRLGSPNTDMTWTQRLEETPSKRGPTLTTSGVLASVARDVSLAGAEVVGPTPQDENPFAVFDTNDDPMAIPQYTDDFPLFSLMTDYDDASNSFLDML